MTGFFNLLASGTRSLSFEKKQTALDFECKPYESRIKPRMPRKPRTPEEIMRSVWEEVGNHMWEAMRAVEKEYGQQIAQSK